MRDYKIEPLIFLYPEDGTIKSDLAKGVARINYATGQFVDTDGSITDLERQLPAGEYIRSAVVTVGAWCYISTSANEKHYFSQGTFKLIGLKTTEIIVNMINTLTPDENNFRIVASTCPVPVIDPTPYSESKNVTGTGADAYTVTHLRSVDNMEQIHCAFEETGGANAGLCRIRVGGSATQLTTIYEDEALSASGLTTFDLESKGWAFVELAIKNASAGNNCTYSNTITGRYTK